MDFYRCAQLDQLGRELIKAYRRVDDLDVFCLESEMDPSSEITRLHLLMAKHHQSCPMCRQQTRVTNGANAIPPA
jgi:hypothetical protein